MWLIEVSLLPRASHTVMAAGKRMRQIITWWVVPLCSMVQIIRGLGVRSSNLWSNRSVQAQWTSDNKFAGATIGAVVRDCSRHGSVTMFDTQ